MTQALGWSAGRSRHNPVEVTHGRRTRTSDMKLYAHMAEPWQRWHNVDNILTCTGQPQGCRDEQGGHVHSRKINPSAIILQNAEIAVDGQLARQRASRMREIEENEQTTLLRLIEVSRIKAIDGTPRRQRGLHLGTYHIKTPAQEHQTSGSITFSPYHRS
jgi:hypothetical protein